MDLLWIPALRGEWLEIKLKPFYSLNGDSCVMSVTQIPGVLPAGDF
ncbi:MAG: hypothetical protein Sw2LagTSB_33420 [Shewanella algae]